MQRGRWSQSGSYYAVTLITRARMPLFKDDPLAQRVVAELQGTALAEHADPVAWVVMPDHLHWLFQLKTGHPSSAVQARKSRITRSINAVRSGQGSVWQPGFYDHHLRNEEDLVHQARYIIANPLRRGLVTKLCDYPYSWRRFVHCEADL